MKVTSSLNVELDSGYKNRITVDGTIDTAALEILANSWAESIEEDIKAGKLPAQYDPDFIRADDAEG